MRLRASSLLTGSLLFFACACLFAGIFRPDNLRTSEASFANRSGLARFQSPLLLDQNVAFGAIPVGRATTRTVSVFNNHFSSVRINEVGTSCGCTVAHTSANVIQPFHHGRLTVKITPSMAGKGSKSVEITTNRGTVEVFADYVAVEGSPSDASSRQASVKETIK